MGHGDQIQGDFETSRPLLPFGVHTAFRLALCTVFPMGGCKSAGASLPDSSGVSVCWMGGRNLQPTDPEDRTLLLLCSAAKWIGVPP